MKISTLINSVDKISEERDYWFVRTDGGDNFETFVDNGFIGIGWNEVTRTDILKRTPVEIKEMIEKANKKVDLNTRRGKSYATSAYNKIIRFNEFKQGDVIVIPSSSSAKLAFGIIQDDSIYNGKPIDNCDYIKRRKVEWIKDEYMPSLNPIFYRIIRPQQTIYDIKPYAQYIDVVIESLFIKNNFTHYVISVQQEGNIDFNALTDFLDSIKTLVSAINKEFNLNEQNQPLSIKLNLQSKGIVELIKEGTAMIYLSLILSSCQNGVIHSDLPQLQKINTDHAAAVRKLDSSVEKLRVTVKQIKKH